MRSRAPSSAWRARTGTARSRQPGARGRACSSPSVGSRPSCGRRGRAARVVGERGRRGADPAAPPPGARAARARGAACRLTLDAGGTPDLPLVEHLARLERIWNDAFLARWAEAPVRSGGVGYLYLSL